ncbi:hypothetical protein [Actinomadura kijaniata]|uniref:hypothetical protein n=1 Tax=Actinomadura kijaniata TaxID=46161 RepID=UPI000832C7AA|nr:hypothetical protein [Actinomadura kijaniata]
MSQNNTHPPTDPTDAALDAFLTIGSGELLGYLREHVDPSLALGSLLALPPDTATTVRTLGTASPSTPAAHAQSHLELRIACHQLAHALTDARTLIGDFISTASTLRPLALAADLDISCAADMEINFARARNLSRDLSRVLSGARDLAHGQARASIFDRALTDSLIRAVDRAHSAARELNYALDYAPDRIEYSRVVTLAAVINANLAPVLSHAQDAKRSLLEEKVDVSGMDLRTVQVTRTNLEMLAGMMWDEATRWPSGLRNQIKARSEQVQPGRYRVHSGTERDPHQAIHP